ncbi:MAG: hypothetical protein AB7K09_25995 [Planctomycetota bacterium]
MDCRQVLRQLRHIGANMTWPGGAPVFGRVQVSAQAPGPDAVRAPGPALIIQWNDAGPAGDDRAWRRMGVRLHVLAANATDAHGESALLDGAPTLGSTSAGAGIARLCSAVRGAFGVLTPNDGFDAFARLVDQPGLQGGTRTASSAQARFDLEVRHRDVPTFPPPRTFVATAGVGEVALAWSAPADRFDLTGVMIRRNTGSAPATPDAGTLVYEGSGDVAHTDTGLSPAVDYFYSLWATYDADLSHEAGTPVTDTYSDNAKTASATPT